METCLLDLLYELRETDVRLILGGGYGLYLKRRLVEQQQHRTLLPALPFVRSTNDLDLFLRTEIVADAHRFTQLSEALQRLGCQPVQSAKFLQFTRKTEAAGQQGEVKLDFLTGPANPKVGIERIRTDGRRWRPRTSNAELHARPTLEAIGIEEGLLEVPIQGSLSTGDPSEASVFLPQPFTYALMKLHAFRDRKDDPAKDHARHHALDLYTLVALATESEWEASLELRERYAKDASVQAAAAIVQEYFRDGSALGVLRLREHPQYRPDLDLPGFLDAIHELLDV